MENKKKGINLGLADERKINKIKKLAEMSGMDFWNIKNDEDEERRRVQLDLCERAIIRSGVISSYVLIDEFITNVICNHFFPKKDPMRLWRTKRFKNFNFHILEGMSLNRKLALARKITHMPKNISKDIESINTLRNALAHMFFPENHSAYKKKGKLLYKDYNLFTLKGYKKFSDDVDHIMSFLVEELYGPLD